MLNEIYKAIKERLSGIAGVKHLDWFNDQYNGIIHSEPGIFIEFVGEIQTKAESKEVQSGDIRVRIHVYSKVLSRQDKSLPQDKIDNHYEIVKEVFRRLQGYRAMQGDSLLFNSMQRVAIENHQYMEGWFVTTQDFVMTGYEIETGQRTMRPDAGIKVEIE